MALELNITFDHLLNEFVSSRKNNNFYMRQYVLESKAVYKEARISRNNSSGTSHSPFRIRSRQGNFLRTFLLPRTIVVLTNSDDTFVLKIAPEVVLAGAVWIQGLEIENRLQSDNNTGCEETMRK